MKTIQTDSVAIRLRPNQAGFETELTYEKHSDGIETVTLRAHSDVPVKPDGFVLEWECPLRNIHCRFTTHTDRMHNLPPDWWGVQTVSAASGAPLLSYYSLSGENRMTVCASDCLYETTMKGGVYEETANLNLRFSFLSGIHPPMTDYTVTLRIDTRGLPYYQAVQDAVSWLEGFPGYTPAPVPDAARLPMYSAWYSFHQDLDPDALLQQCRLSKEIGCDTIIVDDGWQTDDNSRGYSYCGDWEVCEAKFPDMKGFVDAVHETGLKVMLWYSVPFVGIHSKAYQRFRNMVLKAPKAEWYVFDVRFKEVRDYLIGTYVNAVKTYGLDGLKLDFIDCFKITRDSEDQLGEGRDYDSLPEAVDRLMKDVLAVLREVNPEILIEFRQEYIGPIMRTYGNMLRAADCPNDVIANRNRILSLRMLAGTTAVHSDMLMWNYEDSVESAALQLELIFFSVPQISMLLHKLPDDHRKMLRFLLGIWHENQTVLLDGKLDFYQHEALYGNVVAQTPDRMFAAFHSSPIQTICPAGQTDLILLNARMENDVFLSLPEDCGEFSYQIFDCTGTLLEEKRICLNKGVHSFSVPKAGLLKGSLH